MSPRYYIISAVVVLGLTAAISYWKQKRTVREISLVLLQVAAGFALVIGMIAGLAKLLEILGIAQAGFI